MKAISLSIAIFFPCAVVGGVQPAHQVSTVQPIVESTKLEPIEFLGLLREFREVPGIQKFEEDQYLVRTVADYGRISKRELSELGAQSAADLVDASPLRYKVLYISELDSDVFLKDKGWYQYASSVLRVAQLLRIPGALTQNKETRTPEEYEQLRDEVKAIGAERAVDDYCANLLEVVKKDIAKKDYYGVVMWMVQNPVLGEDAFRYVCTVRRLMEGEDQTDEKVAYCIEYLDGLLERSLGPRRVGADVEEYRASAAIVRERVLSASSSSEALQVLAAAKRERIRRYLSESHGIEIDQAEPMFLLMKMNELSIQDAYWISVYRQGCGLPLIPRIYPVDGNSSVRDATLPIARALIMRALRRGAGAIASP